MELRHSPTPTIPKCNLSSPLSIIIYPHIIIVHPNNPPPQNPLLNLSNSPKPPKTAIPTTLFFLILAWKTGESKGALLTGDFCIAVAKHKVGKMRQPVFPSSTGSLRCFHSIALRSFLGQAYISAELLFAIRSGSSSSTTVGGGSFARVLNLGEGSASWVISAPALVLFGGRLVGSVSDPYAASFCSFSRSLSASASASAFHRATTSSSSLFTSMWKLAWWPQPSHSKDVAAWRGWVMKRRQGQEEVSREDLWLQRPRAVC
jgi:hypothetical protein